MKQEKPNLLLPDLYEHPHASIVRECLASFMVNVRQVSPRCSLKFYERNDQLNSKSPRERIGLAIAVGSESLHPVYVKIERRGHLAKKKRDIRIWSYSRGASIYSLPFFDKHGRKQYYGNDISTGIRAEDFKAELFACLRELEPYCMFNAAAFLPENPIKSQGHLLISFCLKDEWLANDDYDFVASIRIECPLQSHTRLKEAIEYKQARILN